MAKKAVRLTGRIGESIYFVRGEKVMFDHDLPVLYHVETRLLVQAVKRNRDRFPADFMFQLSAEEFANLRSQIVISSVGCIQGVDDEAIERSGSTEVARPRSTAIPTRLYTYRTELAYVRTTRGEVDEH